MDSMCADESSTTIKKLLSFKEADHHIGTFIESTPQYCQTFEMPAKQNRTIHLEGVYKKIR